MNKYDVLNVVGEGAYGVVLKCKNKDTNEMVAIKKFKESEEDEAVRKTTLREVKILRIMKHENIVQLKEAFRRKGKLYLVFEFVEKSMLDILEEKSSGVEVETVRLLTFQLLRAIEYCHRHDVIHRDIKPENLLINPADNALRLCDFGFARSVQDHQVLTDYVATRWYRAPELLLGSCCYGKDVDLWAVGCIMGELTDGQPLFAGESEVDQLFVIQKVLGQLSREHMEMFLRNPRFLGIQYPDVSRPETLEKRYVHKMKHPQMQLLKAVLQMEPRKRLPAREALRAPWFEGIKLPRSLRPPSQSQAQGTRTRPESSSSVAADRSSLAAKEPPPPQAAQPGRHNSAGGGGHQFSMQHEAACANADLAPTSPGPSWQQHQRQQQHDHRAPSAGLEAGHHDHAPEPPRQAREDPRGMYEDRSMREELIRGLDPRRTDEQRRLSPLRDDPRALAARDERGARGDDPRGPRGCEDRAGGRQQDMLRENLSGQQYGGPGTPQQQQPQHHGGRFVGASNPYVLPWEDRGGHSSGHEEGGLPPDCSTMSLQGGEGDDRGIADGRRSRQNRRQGTGEAPGPPGPADWDAGRLAGDRGTPGAADRGGTTFGLHGGGASNKGGGARGSQSGAGSMYGGTSANGGDQRDRGQGGAQHQPRHGAGPPLHAATAGTGGSEEWPSTRNMRGLREQPDGEEDKAGWPGGAAQKRKPGRHPGGLGNVPAPPARRSPDPDAWQQQEDSLDIAVLSVRPNQFGGGCGGGAAPWGAGEWHGGHGGGGPNPGGQAELAPVRDPRGLPFETRANSQPARDQRMLGGLGRRGDLSGGAPAYHGH